jgi:P-type Cu+ transporter
MASTQFDIQGMHCASCIVTIAEALKQTRGIVTATDNPAAQLAARPGMGIRAPTTGNIRLVGSPVHFSETPARLY